LQDAALTSALQLGLTETKVETPTTLLPCDFQREKKRQFKNSLENISEHNFLQLGFLL